jgi:hypothetical protein
VLDDAVPDKEDDVDMSAASDNNDEVAELRTELSKVLGSEFLGIKTEDSDEDSDE